jgi:chromate transporter
MPSLLCILLIAMFFQHFQNVPWVAATFAGIRPAVVALMAIPTFNMMKQAHISLLNCWIPIASALLIWGLGVNPVYIILAAGIGGYIYGLFLKPSE